jgi:hypothetical protein
MRAIQTDLLSSIREAFYSSFQGEQQNIGGWEGDVGRH